MIRPELRSIGVSHLDGVVWDDQGRFAPEDRRHYAILVDASIGSIGSAGADLFFFTVCSPSWLEQEWGYQGGLWLRGYLLMPTFNYDVLRNVIAKLCSSIEEPTWESAASTLGRYMRWEFEDDQPAPGRSLRSPHEDSG